MCGICGIVSHDGVKEEMLLSMNEALSHRGPDDRGLYLGQGVGLGHRRLSIIDVAGGRQPMSNEDETVWVVFNGEIYNYRELREDLLQRGHRFETDSDTEVILHLYEEHGERCVEKLSGMFAFGLWDTGARKLFLARDRIGQKPLFYTAGKSGFLFASEVKGLLAHGSVERRMDERSLSHYLSLRFIPAPHTMFRNIRKLPPAHCLVFENGKERIFRYWDLTFRRKVNLPGRAMIDLLEEKLREAVRSHLASDVPVGAFLSGGMDSSMIVALMGGLCADPFKTFAVGVGDGDYNELPHARVVSELYQTEHMEKTVDADLIGSLPEMIRCLDEPSDPIAACMFQAAELAGRHVKVVMGGDGGDELFGGFDRYMGMGLVDHYNKIPEVVRKRIAAPLIGRLRDSFAYKSAAQKLRWVDTLSAYAGGGKIRRRHKHLQVQPRAEGGALQGGGVEKDQGGGLEPDHHRPLQRSQCRGTPGPDAVRGFHDPPSRTYPDAHRQDEHGPRRGSPITLPGSLPGGADGTLSRADQGVGRRTQEAAPEAGPILPSPEDHGAKEAGVHVPGCPLVQGEIARFSHDDFHELGVYPGDVQGGDPVADHGRAPERLGGSPCAALDAAQSRSLASPLHGGPARGCADRRVVRDHPFPRTISVIFEKGGVEKRIEVRGYISASLVPLFRIFIHDHVD